MCPQDRRLLIIATSSDYPTLQDFGITDIFNNKIRVDPVKDVEELNQVLYGVNAFDPATTAKIGRVLADNDPSGRLDLGIKHILQDFSRARASARWYRQQQKSARENEREMGGVSWSDQQEAYEESELAEAEKNKRAETFTRLMVDRMA